METNRPHLSTGQDGDGKSQNSQTFDLQAGRSDDDKLTLADSHAITLIGHILSATKHCFGTKTSITGKDLELFDASGYVPRFIAQDDSDGPLRFIDLLSWEQSKAAT